MWHVSLSEDLFYENVLRKLRLRESEISYATTRYFIFPIAGREKEIFQIAVEDSIGFLKTSDI